MNVDRLAVLEVGGITLAIAGASVVASCFLVACPPSTPPVSPPDASDAAIAVVDATPPSPPKDSTPPPAKDAAPTPAPTAACPNAQAACDHMKAAGCREGSIADCAQVLCGINADPHFAHFNLACLAGAQGAPAVKACGADCTP